MNYLDEAGVNYHALVAVFYALKRKGIDLDSIYDSVDQNIAGQEGLRPPPQDQESVLKAIKQAINDIAR